MMRRLLLGASALSMVVLPIATSTAQPAPLARIVDEGMNRSAVMLTASELTDGIGPRLTNSPGMRRAEEWALAKFRGYGLQLDGRGWSRR